MERLRRPLWERERVLSQRRKDAKGGSGLLRLLRSHNSVVISHNTCNYSLRGLWENKGILESTHNCSGAF